MGLNLSVCHKIKNFFNLTFLRKKFKFLSLKFNLMWQTWWKFPLIRTFLLNTLVDRHLSLIMSCFTTWSQIKIQLVIIYVWLMIHSTFLLFIFNFSRALAHLLRVPLKTFHNNFAIIREIAASCLTFWPGKIEKKLLEKFMTPPIAPRTFSYSTSFHLKITIKCE